MRRSPERRGCAPQDRRSRTGEAERARGRRRALRDSARHHSEHPCSRRAGRRRRRTPMSKCASSATPKKFCVPAEAAFRDRRGARPDGFRDGGENLRRALRGAEGRAGAARARARPVHARPAHERARLHRSRARRCSCATTPCSALRNCRSSQTINSRRCSGALSRSKLASRDGSGDGCSSGSEDEAARNVRVIRLRHRELFQCSTGTYVNRVSDWLAHPHRRSAADQSRARGDRRRGEAADARHRRHAVLPRRGRRGGQGHARHDPPAPVHQGRARLHHHARAIGRGARAHDELAPRPC